MPNLLSGPWLLLVRRSEQYRLFDYIIQIKDLKYLSHFVYAHLGQKMACSVVLPPQADCSSSFLLERTKENNKIRSILSKEPCHL